MLLIRKKAYARAALIGNPSDGYFGKTIALLVRNFWAEVTLYEWDQIELVPSQEDQSRFDSIGALAHDVQLHGYYGGIRLVKATIKKFFEYCEKQRIALHGKNFSIRYQSTIPRQLGLAGSSASSWPRSAAWWSSTRSRFPATCSPRWPSPWRPRIWASRPGCKTA